jgi:uncharacterized protein YbjT (DUF2867 family)
VEKVVVAGATGYLGRFLVQELGRRGHSVRALVRPGKSVEGASEIVEAEATFSSLGITRQTDRVTFMDVDYGANHRLLAEAEVSGVRRFGFVSVVRPELFTDSEMVAARERFVAELRASSIPSCVVRATGFFSDLREPLEMAKKGRVYLIGDGKARINPMHGEDLARASVDALESGSTERAVGGPQTFTWQEIAELAFRALGREPKITHVPEWVVKVALPPVRLFSRRTHAIARFVSRVAVNDVMAPEQGHHMLSQYYAELAKD